MSRSQYITPDERQFLLDLIEKKRDIIFNKATDSRQIPLKAKAWQEITHSLIAAGLGPSRTVKQVKKIWENMKGRAKKVSIEWKKETFHTGGDSPPEEVDVLTANILALIKDELEPPACDIDYDGPVFPAVQFARLTSCDKEGNEGSRHAVTFLSANCDTENGNYDVPVVSRLSTISRPTSPQSSSSLSSPTSAPSHHPSKRQRRLEGTSVESYKMATDLHKIEHDMLMKVHRKKLELMEAKIRALEKEEERNQEINTAELRKIEMEERACEEVKVAKLKQIKAEEEMRKEGLAELINTLEYVRFAVLSATKTADNGKKIS